MAFFWARSCFVRAANGAITEKLREKNLNLSLSSIQYVIQQNIFLGKKLMCQIGKWSHHGNVKRKTFEPFLIQCPICYPTKYLFWARSWFVRAANGETGEKWKQKILIFSLKFLIRKISYWIYPIWHLFWARSWFVRAANGAVTGVAGQRKLSTWKKYISRMKRNIFYLEQTYTIII